MNEFVFLVVAMFTSAGYKETFTYDYQLMPSMSVCLQAKKDTVKDFHEIYPDGLFRDPVKIIAECRTYKSK